MSFVPSSPSNQFREEPLDPDVLPDDLPREREGLPAGFRMRHDAHYVDQLTARVAAPHVRAIPLAELDAPRIPDDPDLGPLVRSIAKYGVLQPVLVRARGNRFELIAGRRRVAAASVAGLTEVPGIVHQADDARAVALAEADNVRRVAALPPPASAGAESAAGDGLRELVRSLDAIGSCLHLLADREATLRDRVALDLIHTEAHRAALLVRCLDVWRQDPVLTEADVPAAALVDQVLDGFAAERRLAGIDIGIEDADPRAALRGDAHWLSVGVAAAVAGMLALVQGAKTPALGVRIAAGPGPAVSIQVTAESVSLSGRALGRFFDEDWTDRPGGRAAAIELAVASKVARLHGGLAEVAPGERGGCRVSLVIPAAG